jgi:hypothetical protein
VPLPRPVAVPAPLPEARQEAQPLAVVIPLRDLMAGPVIRAAVVAPQVIDLITPPADAMVIDLITPPADAMADGGPTDYSDDGTTFFDLVTP